MPPQDENDIACLRVPNPCRVVLRYNQYASSVGTELKIGIKHKFGESGDLFTGFDVPEPCCSVLRSRHQAASIGAQPDIRHRAAVSLEYGDLPPRLGVPNPRRLVGGSCHNAASIRAVGNGHDNALMSLQRDNLAKASVRAE